MTEFERELVKAFNRFFKEEEIKGYAHRMKQHRFSSQICDVLVDSPHEMFYLAIENKSVKTDSTNKLYFSQHFSKANDMHQVERISQFIQKSGRRGFLAVELKRGRGKERKAYLVPWNELTERYDDGSSGLSLETIKEYPEITRDSADYSVAELCMELEI